MQMLKTARGQSTLEFAVLLGVIVLCFVALSNYIRFAASGRLKSSADSISQTLFNPEGGSSTLEIDRTSRDISNADGSSSSAVEVGEEDTTTRTDTL